MSVKEAKLIDLSDRESWGYLTFKKRLPQYVGDVLRDGSAFLSGEAIENLRKLKEEVEQAGVIKPIEARSEEERKASEDVDEWKEYMRGYEGKRWDELPFYWLEAYYYRRMLQESQYFLNKYDPFSQTKTTGITDSLRVMKSIAYALLDVINRAKADSAVVDEAIELFLLRSLWGNKADLSLFSVSEDPLALVHQKLSKDKDESSSAAAEEMKYLLVDESPQVLRLLQQLKDAKNRRVDIILDNSGLELFSDLCFAHALSELLDVEVHLHLKRDPMFVSDAMPKDVFQLIEALEKEAQDSSDARSHELATMTSAWRRFIESGKWKLRPHRFWNSALFFDRMESTFPDLYHDLQQSRVAFIKGDANYRRLVGDYYYPHTTPFVSLVTYFPTHAVALRVLKSEVAVGMAPGQAESVAQKDPQWLVDGKWATIQHSPGRSCSS